MVRNTVSLIAVLAACLVFLTSCGDDKSTPGKVPDEAKTANLTSASFRHSTDDYFHDMDNGIVLTPEEAAGRNMWILWTGGNDRFWDVMTVKTFGAFDLLKLVTSHPSQQFGRDPEHEAGREARWQEVGLINDPCYEQPRQKDPERFDLYLDVRKKECGPEPFEDEVKYPGVPGGARGTTFDDKKKLPVGSFYGINSGIVGLRLFPNPAFNKEAEKNWNAEKYYTDPDYYNDPKLIRPYRVGMSCGFCHVGPSPIHPPAIPAHPRWSELNSTVGAQYLWVDRIFADNSAIDAQPQSQRNNFVYQLVHTYRPGTMDTSLVSTDNINNPRTMNAVYSVMSRVLPLATLHGKEALGAGNLLNKQFNQYPEFSGSPLNTLFEAPSTVLTPRVLKDGSDSVGVLGALNRVYLNIGVFSEEWLLHFNAVVGGKLITPIEISVAEKNSVYWQATEAGTPNMARFLLKAGQPDKLAAAPGGMKYLTPDLALVNRGRTVFANTCARCHSSKTPTPPAGADVGACAGPGYLACWNKYWAWTKTEDFKSQMRQMADDPDFLVNNYLSSELRVPVTLLKTNACSPLATNAIAGNIWDNFSSQSYKDLPSVGSIKYHDPISGEEKTYNMPAGGRGYTRPPSLISVWSTAPFLLNNTLAEFDDARKQFKFDQDPSVDARMRIFNISIEQLLWPEKRPHDPVLGDKVGWIDRTTDQSWIYMPAAYTPELLHPFQQTAHRWFPWLVSDGGNVKIGPIPQGTPVNLLANLQLLSETDNFVDRVKHTTKLFMLLRDLEGDLRSIPAGASNDVLKEKFKNLSPRLLELSKCPDFEVNRGHYFGTSMAEDEPRLSDDEKRALIEFLKTL